MSDDLAALQKRLEQEEAAYASFLAAVDRLAGFAHPAEKLPELPEQLARLNALWAGLPPPEGRGPAAQVRRGIWDTVGPSLARQSEFNAALVQILNGHLDQTARLHANLRDLFAELTRYLQRVLPVMDARDRVATTLATSRAELILESFDRRLESLGRRLEGLGALRDRIETLSEEVRALVGSLSARTPEPAVAAAAQQAAGDAVYVAFERRFRGDPEEIRERLACYVDLFRGLSPVVELGCGRGEFLELLREQGIDARGVEANAGFVEVCRERKLAVAHGDLLAFLRSQPDAQLGGLFAAQVAEHLPPAALLETLRESHRVLRPGGLLVLETVNPRSLVAFLEIYNRDLSHERPLHPDTLRFMAAAAGFGDVRIELRSPVDAASRLRVVPGEGLPPRAAEALNENVQRLNDLLYGPQEYALIARR